MSPSRRFANFQQSVAFCAEFQVIRSIRFMRKRIIEQLAATSGGKASDSYVLPVESIAEIEITSAHPDRPIEGALSGTGGPWVRSHFPPVNKQSLIVFDEPQRARKDGARVFRTRAVAYAGIRPDLGFTDRAALRSLSSGSNGLSLDRARPPSRKRTRWTLTARDEIL